MVRMALLLLLLAEADAAGAGVVSGGVCGCRVGICKGKLKKLVGIGENWMGVDR